VPADELAEALAFASKNLPHIGGLMDTGWRFVAPDEPSMADRQAAGGLYWWHGREGLIATWEGDDDDGPVLGIGFAATTEPGQLSEMLRDGPRLASGMNAYAVFWLAPREAEVEQALQEAGFTTDEDAGVLYERGHP
jgi:hypothetical protein